MDQLTRYSQAPTYPAPPFGVAPSPQQEVQQAMRKFLDQGAWDRTIVDAYIKVIADDDDVCTYGMHALPTTHNNKGANKQIPAHFMLKHQGMLCGQH